MPIREAIDYVTVRGFKSIKAIEQLRLLPINVLIGANGSGKSNFIGAFSFLHTVREGELQDYVRRAGGANQILHFGTKVTKQISFVISFNDEVNQYELSLKPSADDELYVASEWTSFWDKSQYDSPLSNHIKPLDGGKEAGISNHNVARIAGWVRRRLGLFRLYHVHDTSLDSPMRRTAQVSDNHFLRPDGSNLPAFLYLLQETEPEEYQLIRKTIQRVTPFFDDFLLKPERLNPDTIRLSWKHRGSSQYFGASSLSDGTLRFIVLATLFLQPVDYRPAVIVVDEPELGLHPLAITMLASLVKQASVETQIILSTQSGLLLDHFEPENVLVAERIEGATQLRRLSSQDLSEWLEDYGLGQLWEKNEIGGRPRAGG